MSDHETNSDSTEFNLTDAIANLEASLDKIKQRHQQIIEDQAKKSELENRQAQIKDLQAENKNQDSIKSELHYIEKELAEIELRLESELFKSSSLIEPFWMIVRFGGIGVIIGWILKTMNN
ncbi:hypothetical protein [Geminocystis sp. GBBB08]|uniref:hypothetical protein n=1 Tax=Geminocystis sp. GBBB08 TaxID=2604140 RepID=UPI0027E24844|nr:hypothetical protein [Geminocystis sp. GBBB08]MBL1209331.1 hypothetical protein [Geminocystis sp. GBBB08]